MGHFRSLGSETLDSLMLTENGKGYTNCALQLDVISVLFFCKKSLLACHAFGYSSTPLVYLFMGYVRLLFFTS